MLQFIYYLNRNFIETFAKKPINYKDIKIQTIDSMALN